MDIKEFRQQYPQYEDLSDLDLARALHATHYADVPYHDFSRAFGVSEPWNVSRGFVVAMKQMPQLGYGLAALASAGLETAFGEGGLSTAAKHWAVKGYEEWGNSIQHEARETDEFDVAYERARGGDFGALVDWLGYGIGYALGQGAQILGTAGAGAVAGRVVLKPAVEKFASGLVSKEVAAIAGSEAGKTMTGEAIQRLAVGKVAGSVGRWGALGTQAFGMEGGEIGGELVSEATREGRVLSGSELARAAGATALAGGLEFVGDALGYGAITGRLAMKPVAEMTGLKGKAARGLTAMVFAAPGEAATEYFQTGLEEYGAGREGAMTPLGQAEESRRQALNAAALGALGGGVHASIGGMISSPEKRTATAVGEILKAPSTDAAISAAMRSGEDRTFDLHDAETAALQTTIDTLHAEDKARAMAAAKERDAEIGALLRERQQAEAAALINKAVGAGAFAQALSRARLPGESQKAHLARLAQIEQQEVGATTSASEPADVRVFGRSVGEMTHEELAEASATHPMSAFREAARTEIARRSQESQAVEPSDTSKAAIALPEAKELPRDRQDEERIPSEIGERAQSVQAQPEQRAGAAPTKASRILQEQEFGATQPRDEAVAERRVDRRTAPLVFGKRLEELDDKGLALVAKAGSATLKEAAKAELERRSRQLQEPGAALRPGVAPGPTTLTPEQPQQQNEQNAMDLGHAMYLRERAAKIRENVQRGILPAATEPVLAEADRLESEADRLESEAASTTRVIEGEAPAIETDNARAVFKAAWDKGTTDAEVERNGDAYARLLWGYYELFRAVDERADASDIVQWVSMHRQTLPLTYDEALITLDEYLKARAKQVASRSMDDVQRYTPPNEIGYRRRAITFDKLADAIDHDYDGVLRVADALIQDSAGAKAMREAKATKKAEYQEIANESIRIADSYAEAVKTAEEERFKPHNPQIERLKLKRLNLTKSVAGTENGWFMVRYKNEDWYTNRYIAVDTKPIEKIEEMLGKQHKAERSERPDLSKVTKHLDDATATLNPIADYVYPERDINAVVLENANNIVAIQRANFDLVKKLYPQSRFMVPKDYDGFRAIAVKQHNKLVGMVMTIALDLKIDEVRAILAKRKAPAPAQLQDDKKAVVLTENREQLPTPTGKKWGDAEDRKLLAGFDAGQSLHDLAINLQRTEAEIRARLVQYGRLTESTPTPAKEEQAATGSAEERSTALRDRDTAVLVPPEGTAPPREAVQALDTIAQALRTAAKSIEKAVSPVQPDQKRIEDVGENLWYNRRNFTRGVVTWDSVKNLNDALKVKEVVKARVWPKPDYEQLVADGLHPFFARMLKQVYDGIATAPTSKTDDNLQRYIIVVSKVREAVFDWAKDKNSNRELLNKIAEREINPNDIRDAVLERIWPGRDRLYKDNVRNDLRVIGGDRALRALQFTVKDMVNAMKDVGNGWPTPQEEWRRRGYQVIERDPALTIRGLPRSGQWAIEVNGHRIGYVRSLAKARETVASWKAWLVQDKYGDVVASAETEDAAKEMARYLTKRKTRGGEIRGMNIAEAKREGPEHRNPGDDVSAERLMNEFGLRGVNFGREGWINQAERQAYLNHAYDGLLDLSEILDVSPKALSLNGMLGIAFGAQGRGGFAAAHFVPGVNEINLTKTKGAGTLAHEWGHALDHYFATQAGLAKSPEPFLSAGAKVTSQEIRPEIVAAFKTIIETMEKRPMTAAEMAAQNEMAKKRAADSLESWLQHFRKDIEKNKTSDEALRLFDEAAERLRKGDIGDGYAQVGRQRLPAVVGAIKLVVRDHTKNSSVDISGNYKNLASNAMYLAYKLAQKEATQEHVPQSTTYTDYATESERKDREKGGKAYWRTRWEMFARAFEAWVADKLSEKAQVNTFLSNATTRAEMLAYPRGEDRARINAAIDKLIDAIETKETDKGVAMFSRSSRRAVGEGRVSAWEDAPHDESAYIHWGDYHRRTFGKYVNDGLVVENSRTTPIDEVLPPLGSWRIYDHGGPYGREIEKLVEIPIDKLILEELDSRGRLDPVKAGDEVRYAGWLKSGRRAPPIEVVQTDSGRLTVTDGHRRVLAAKLAGRNTIEAWVNFAVPTPLGRRYDGKPDTKFIRTGMTFEMLTGKVANPYVNERMALSRGGAISEGISREAARAELVQAFGKNGIAALEESGFLELTTSDDARLDSIRDQMLGVEDAIYWQGKAWLFVDRMAPGVSPNRLLHELGEHHGLEEMLGEPAYIRLQKRIETMAKSGNVAVRQAWDRVKERYSDYDEGSKEFISEVIAALSEDVRVTRQAWWHRLLDAIKVWLAKLGLNVRNEKDIVALLRASLRKVMREAEEPVMIGGSAPAFARANASDTSGFDGESTFDKIVREFSDRVRKALAEDKETHQSARISQNSPASLRVFGWRDLPVEARIGKDGLLKMRFDHGMTPEQIGRLIPSTLKRPAMILQHVGVGDVESLRFIAQEEKQGKPIMVAVRPENTGATGMRHLVATMLPLNEGWANVARAISRGALLYRDTRFSAPAEVRQAIVGAQKKFAAEPRSLLGLIPNSAPVRQRRNYIVLTEHALVKWERENWGDAPKFSRASWIGQQPADTQEALRKAGVLYAPPTLKDRIKAWSTDWQKRVKQGVFDQFDPIKEYDYHAYMLARMTRGADAALEALLQYGTVYLDQDGAIDVKYEKGGFLGIMSKLDGEHDRFLAWVIGNRAERLLSEGREHNFTAQDIARLKALNQGQMPDGKPRTQEYARVRAELDRYNKAVLDIAERAGLIDANTRPVWEKDFYVPFYRLMEDDQVRGPMLSRGLVNQYAFKVLKGGEQALGDPMHNILKNWSHLLDASLKNQAARESLLAAQRMGAVVEGDESTVRQMAKAGGMKDAVVSFTDQGTKRWFMVEDPFLLDAIKAVGFSGFQGVGLKIMQKFKRWLTLGVTVSPTFRIRNLIRDSLQMIGTNPASYNVLDNVLTGWKVTEEGSPEFASILAGGGVMRFGTLIEGERAEHVKRLIEAGIDDKTILSTPQRIKDMLQEAWDWWQHVGDRAENINRVALYKTLRAKGKTHFEASFAARDTMDFSMQGAWAAIRFLSQTVPFWNARLQGLYKLGRGAAEDPRRFGFVVGGAALASIALLLAYKDDDDWKHREDWDRETYWWFKIGDKAFRIPKPFEIGAIATIAERALEAMISDELTGRQFANRVYHIATQQLSLNPVPQLAMPVVELYANRDSFTDRPIEGLGMKRLSKPMRAGLHTSVTAQLLGKNGLISPVQIDHLVNGYFGWLGSHVVATADLALRPAMDLPGKAAWRIDEVLVIGDFVEDLPQYQSKYITHLYDQMKEVQQAMADLKELQRIAATEEARKLMQDKANKLKLYRLYTNAEQRMQKVNAQIRLTQARRMDADVKRERLNSLYAMRNRVARITEEAARATRQ